MIKLPLNFDSHAPNISKLRLTGGLAGKMCYVLIFLAISMAGIACRIGTELIAILAITIVSFVTLVVLWRLLNLASKNPQSALMEGAEYLAHEQIVMGSKNSPVLISNVQDVVKKEPLEISPSKLKTLNQSEKDPDKNQLPPSPPSAEEA